jgi:hypothetical protein
MEPGDKDIMKDRPRPKTQNIMLWWMFKFMLAKAAGCTVPNVIAYCWALNHYAGELEYDKIADQVTKELDAFDVCADAKTRRMLGEERYSELNAKVSELSSTESESWVSAAWEAVFVTEPQRKRMQTVRRLAGSQSGGADMDRIFEECYDTEGMEANVYRAQTAVFVGMVWSENVMGYVARSFDKPIWHNFLGNPAMQKATIFAEIGLFLAAILLPTLWFPGRKYFLSLDATEIGGIGWFIAFVGAGGCVLLCELYKLYARKDIKAFLESQKAQLSLAEQERLRQAAAAQEAAKQGNPNEAVECKV